jgi:hypothetical protein
MPEVRNPGLATVSTDGVTITGAGTPASPVALLAVQHDATLSGAGTVASPLAAAQQTPTGWPIAAYSTGLAPTLGTVVGANSSVLWAWFLPASVTFSHIAINIAFADAANNSDVGIYNAAGTLLADVGAQHMGSTGNQVFNVSGGAKTVGPGLIFFLCATASGTFSINSSTGLMALNFTTAFAASVGGACPASITPPSIGNGGRGPAFCLF